MTDSAKSLARLHRRPGFLIRRAHQIAVTIFLEEAARIGVTTTQYGAMVALRARGEVDQAGLSKLVGIDRSTTALVVSKLKEAGYIVRRNSDGDRRRKLLSLTAKGETALDALAEPAERARERLLSVFTAGERAMFLELLERLVSSFNADARAPMTAGLIEDASKRNGRADGRATVRSDR